MRFGDHVPGHRHAAFRAEMTHAGDDDAPDDAEFALGILDARHRALQMIEIAHPHFGGVVGRGEHLDINRALAGTGGEIFVRNVTVILGLAQAHAGRVIGAQEIGEVGPGKIMLVGEQAVGQRDTVALGQAAHQCRRRRAFEMHMKLRLGDRARHANPRNGISGPRTSQLSSR